MADDGLLLNFSVEDTSAITTSSAGQYKGRWKERALSKKWDKIKATRALKGSSVFVSAKSQSAGAAISSASEPNGINGANETNGTVGNKDVQRTEGKDEVHSRGMKRKRGQASAANATPVIPRIYNSSSLFTGNPEISQQAVSKDPPAKVQSTAKEPANISSKVESTSTHKPSTDEQTIIEHTISPLITTSPAITSEFASLGISPAICNHLTKSLSISKPTQIQSLAIPHLLSTTSDTFLRSQTGSGKTLAFLLPILHKLLSLPTPTHQFSRTSGLFAIILSPTRELAHQTEDVLAELTRGTWIVPGWLLGGENKKSEKARLRKGVNILVATPGRLMDHLELTMVFDTSLVRWIVLDEGDRLVDMGFLESVGKILRIIEGRVQHRIQKEKREAELSSARGGDGKKGFPDRLVKVLCSATLRGEEGLGALETIVDPVFLKGETFEREGSDEVDTDGLEKMITPGQLTQKTIILPAKLRLVTLLAILTSFSKGTSSTHSSTPSRSSDDTSKMIIFLSCSTSVSFHHSLLSSYSLPSLSLFHLHGTLPQPIRTATLKSFISQKGKSVLLATDVASRGLDLSHVDKIIQYDPPATIDDYVHRIGRTARAGRIGEGLLFLLPSEEGYVDKLRTQGMMVEGVGYEGLLKEVWGQGWMDKATEMQLHAEKWVLQDQEVFIPFSVHFLKSQESSWILTPCSQKFWPPPGPLPPPPIALIHHP